MLGKPILAIISPGQQIPVGMRKVADEIVEADVDLAEGRELIQAAIERMMAREPRYGVCGCGAEMDEHGCPHGH
jgi:hypothetical protein